MGSGFAGIAVIPYTDSNGSYLSSVETIYITSLVVLLFFNSSVIPALVLAESFSLFRQARPPAIILVDPAIKDMIYTNTKWPLKAKNYLNISTKFKEKLTKTTIKHYRQHCKSNNEPHRTGLRI